MRLSSTRRWARGRAVGSRVALVRGDARRAGSGALSALFDCGREAARLGCQPAPSTIATVGVTDRCYVSRRRGQHVGVLFGVILVALVAGCASEQAVDTAQPSRDSTPQAVTPSQESAGAETSQAATPTVPVSVQLQEAYQLLDHAVNLLTVVAPLPAEAQLGNRFEWCSDVATLWGAYATAQEALESVRAALRHAEDVHDTATDDLDRAEALQAVQDAREVLELAEWAYGGARRSLHDDLASAYSQPRSGHSRGVAYVRAWSAFVSHADPRTLTAIADHDAALAEYDAALAEYGVIGQDAEAVYEADLANARARREEALNAAVEALNAAVEALDAAVAQPLSGSLAYDAYRDSFRESCQPAGAASNS